MRWLERLLCIRSTPEPDEGTTAVDLDAARAARVEAERKLAATQRAGHDIRRVADVARAIRSRDNFTAEIDRLFGRQG